MKIKVIFLFHIFRTRLCWGATAAHHPCAPRAFHAWAWAVGQQAAPLRRAGLPAVASDTSATTKHLQGLCKTSRPFGVHWKSPQKKIIFLLSTSALSSSLLSPAPPLRQHIQPTVWEATGITGSEHCPQMAVQTLRKRAPKYSQQRHRGSANSHCSQQMQVENLRSDFTL